MTGDPKRSVGTVTGAAAGGATVGAALAAIVVWAWPAAEPIESPLTVLLAAGLSVLGGYLVPPKAAGRHRAD